MKNYAEIIVKDERHKITVGYMNKGAVCIFMYKDKRKIYRFINSYNTFSQAFNEMESFYYEFHRQIDRVWR